MGSFSTQQITRSRTLGQKQQDTEPQRNTEELQVQVQDLYWHTVKSCIMESNI